MKLNFNIFLNIHRPDPEKI